MEGAANLESRIAQGEMRLGDFKPSIIYNKTVLRKLRQEIRDKDLGLSSRNLLPFQMLYQRQLCN